MPSEVLEARNRRFEDSQPNRYSETVIGADHMQNETNHARRESSTSHPRNTNANSTRRALVAQRMKSRERENSRNRSGYMVQGFAGPGEDGGEEIQLKQKLAPFEYFPHPDRQTAKDYEVFTSFITSFSLFE